MVKTYIKPFVMTLVIIITAVMVLFTAKNIAKRSFPLHYKEYILKYSNENNLDPYLVTAVIRTESNFNSDALSRKDAKGLMQIMDDTAKWIAQRLKIKKFKTEDIFDAETNIKFGCWYLNNLREQFGENPELILAAYNGGRGNVKNWLNNKKYSKDGKSLQYIPFRETDRYIKKVRVTYNVYKYLYPDFVKETF
jgi:soluble lytic murein transglycosylase